MSVNKTDSKEVALFFKYAIFVPVILTILFEWLEFTGVINVPWYWLFCPIWIWLGGAFQFMLGGILTEFFEGKK